MRFWVVPGQKSLDIVHQAFLLKDKVLFDAGSLTDILYIKGQLTKVLKARIYIPIPDFKRLGLKDNFHKVLLPLTKNSNCALVEA